MAYICENDNDSIICKGKLHNPIENIVKIAINVNLWPRLLVRKFLVYFYVFEKKNSPNIDIKALSSKKKVTDALATLEVPVKR